MSIDISLVLERRGTSGQCSEFRALREVWRVQPRLAKILEDPAKAARGVRNRSQRCSARRLTLSRNEEPLCGSSGAFEDELKIQCGGKHGLCYFRHKPH